MTTERFNYTEAREFVRALGLKSAREWKAWLKTGERPEALPTKPEVFYRDKGWVSWGEFLGTGVIAKNLRNYAPYEEAQAYAQSLKIVGMREWREHIASGTAPESMPSHAERIYKDKWVSWGEFLGTSHIAPGKFAFRTFCEARDYVQHLGLRTAQDYKTWAKGGERPADIPSNPNLAYASTGWTNWPDFLGMA